MSEMQRKFSARAFLVPLDRVATVTDFMAVWDYVDGAPEHFDPSKQADLERFFADVLRSVAQTNEYVKMVPKLEARCIRQHNERLAVIVDSEWRRLGLRVCDNCARLFVPTKPKHDFCSGCFDSFNEIERIAEDSP